VVLQSQGRQVAVEAQPGTGVPTSGTAWLGHTRVSTDSVFLCLQPSKHQESAAPSAQGASGSGNGSASASAGVQKERSRGLRPFEGASLLWSRNRNRSRVRR